MEHNRIRTFDIPEIRGKGRPRFDRGSKRPRTPEETRRYEEKVRHRYSQKYGKAKVLEGAVFLQISVYRSRPKSHFKVRKGCRTAFLYENIPQYPLKTPDLSNIIKIIEDALNGIAYKDDRQIVTIAATSRYNGNNRADLVSVSILPLQEIDYDK